MNRRLGAYILAGDPVWLRSSLSRYYDLLEELIVLVPGDGRGWTGRAIPVQACLDAVREVDHRGIHRLVVGSWVNRADPMRADTAQRQAGIDAIGTGVDWILQIDNDEVLPAVDRLLEALDYAERHHLRAVEWPMRVLFRGLRRSVYLEVCSDEGGARFDYPGPIAVRPGTILSDARRAGGGYLRPMVLGDTVSLQLTRPAVQGEIRAEVLSAADAILHNSWGRSARDVWRKTRSWGHAEGPKGVWYFASVWLVAPLTWRILRDVHPFARGLWPRLRPTSIPVELLHPSDRPAL